MKFNRWIIGAVIGASLLVASIGVGIVLAQSPETDQTQEPSYQGSITVDETQTEGLSEADEATALQGQAKITADQAKAAAEAANSGASVTKVELGIENGVLVYSVELSNGLDVKVDAGDGKILHTDQAGEESEVDEASEAQEAEDNEAEDPNDQDTVENEQESQQGN